MTVTAITLLAAAIRLYRLGAPSLWLDEAWSYAIATMPWWAMRHIITTRETNMGPYYVLLRPWIAVFGSSEAALRSLPALASIATVPIAYAAGKRMFGTGAGIVAALLLALSPVSVVHGRDARAYALEIMFIAAGLLFLLRTIERPTATNLAGWILSNILAVFAHSFAIAAVPAELLPLLLCKRVPWRRLLGGGAAIAIVVAPLLLLVAHNDHGQINWIPPLDWGGVGEALFGLANGMATEGSGQAVVSAYGLGILVGLVGFVRAYDRSPSAATGFALAASGAVFPFMLVVVLSLHKPMLYYRYLIFSLPFLCLFVAGGLASMRSRIIQALVLAALMAGSIWHTWFMVEGAPRYDWRLPARYILAHGQTGDALAVRYWPYRILMDYYFARMHAPPGFIDDVYPDWEPDLFINGHYVIDSEAQEFLAGRLLAKFDAVAASGRRLWFLIDGESMGIFDQWASLEMIERRLSEDYASVRGEFVEGFTIFLCSGPRKQPHRTP